MKINFNLANYAERRIPRVEDQFEAKSEFFKIKISNDMKSRKLCKQIVKTSTMQPPLVVAATVAILAILGLLAPPEVRAWNTFDPIESPARALFGAGIESQLQLPAANALTAPPMRPSEPVNEPLKSQESIGSSLMEVAGNLLQSAANASSSFKLPDSTLSGAAPSSGESGADSGSTSSKIMQALSAAASNSTTADKVLNHLFKPRNKNSPPATKSSAFLAEQQIINQHAMKYQRLRPTKQRDNKISTYMDTSGLSGNRHQLRDSSALALILNNLKLSGISSRSSIVKAISDNKLGRSK